MADLSVTATRTPKPPAWEIGLTVAGLPAGATAVVDITGSDGTLSGSNLDSRCVRTGTDSARCTLGASGGLGPFTFRSRAIAGATLTFTVSSSDVTDPTPGNNTTSVAVD